MSPTTDLKMVEIEVDYGSGLPEAVNQCSLDHVDKKILGTEKFRCFETGKAVIKIAPIKLGRLSFGDIPSVIGARSLQPALLIEALAFAECFPNLQKEHPLYPLGNIWFDHIGIAHAACLTGGPQARTLLVREVEAVCTEKDLFLVVER